MQNIVVSINENLLKVSINDQNGFRTSSRALDGAIVSSSQILNVDLFADQLHSLLSDFGDNKIFKLPLQFLVEPEDVTFQFITVSKSQDNLEEYVLQQVSQLFPNLDDLYFSYQKIAPFVYQLITVKKDVVHKLMDVSTKLGINLMSIVPWLGLLPKFMLDNNPAIFITKSNGRQVIALSELNGIYYSGVYESSKSSEEIQRLVQELSVYKRAEPISRVYTLNNDDFRLDSNYQVMELPVPTNALTQDSEFKIHTLLNSVLEKNESLLETQLNLLTMLPLPTEKTGPSKAKVMVTVGAIAVLALLGAGGYFLYNLVNSSNGEVAGDTNGTVNEQTETPESTASTVPSNSTVPQEEFVEEPVGTTDIPADLNREDIRIRIENGAGIAGIAAQTEVTLESLGYNVIEIGNAEGQDRDNTLVKFKSSKVAYRDLLISDIKDEFEIFFEEGLEESLDYDVLVVVGKN